jgi:hypothetical protein
VIPRAARDIEARGHTVNPAGTQSRGYGATSATEMRLHALRALLHQHYMVLRAGLLTITLVSVPSRVAR